MSEYTYTVDVIGDDAVTDGLIMRTITELVDEHITWKPCGLGVGQLFYDCMR